MRIYFFDVSLLMSQNTDWYTISIQSNIFIVFPSEINPTRTNNGKSRMFSSAVPRVSCDTFSCEIAQVSKPDTPRKVLNQTKWREKRTVQKNLKKNRRE